MLSLNKSREITVASYDNLNNSSTADDDGTASATIEHSDPNLRNGHNSVETNSSNISANDEQTFVNDHFTVSYFSRQTSPVL